MSLAIFAVTKKAATVDQLLRLAYEKFRSVQVMRDVLRELNPELMRPVPIYAGQPKTEKQIQMERDQGKILEAAHPISNYPPAKYKTLIIKHLTVDKDGTVNLK